MSLTKAVIIVASLRLEIWLSKVLTIISRQHLAEELRSRSIGRQEAGQSQIEGARSECTDLHIFYRRNVNARSLGRRVAAVNLPPRTLASLSAALEKQWLAPLAELIHHIIESIIHRYMCCIASRGIISHIKGSLPLPN
ncbi:hypothetical protein TNCV_1059311 [Trichonephila clavipes]|nr:hypothetical protein TNCV_1059311 [Trichonephila clavipes]